MKEFLLIIIAVILWLGIGGIERAIDRNTAALRAGTPTTVVSQ
ncbi:hypothetical protein U1872_06295 [Sphingomonas sp. RB3P16]